VGKLNDYNKQQQEIACNMHKSNNLQSAVQLQPATCRDQGISASPSIQKLQAMEKERNVPRFECWRHINMMKSMQLGERETIRMKAAHVKSPHGGDAQKKKKKNWKNI
jgi:hypothetical protein